MSLSVFEKESSEHSDSTNWAKQQLEGCSDIYVDSIEGYTVDLSRGVIILMDRAKVDYSEISHMSTEDIISEIKNHDGVAGSIQRKINLANIFNVKFRYLLYSEGNNNNHHVWVFLFDNGGSGLLEIEFDSFRKFGRWLNEKRSLLIKKAYGHEGAQYDTSHFEDLPNFDQTLRINNTPWLANLDAFISDKKGNPIALVEFQYTKKTAPGDHCNNIYFLSGKDVNRFMTLEVARVQSSLPLYIIVWSDAYNDYVIKQVECCTIPDYSTDKNKIACENRLLSSFLPSCQEKPQEVYNKICNSMNSYNVTTSGEGIAQDKHSPRLSITRKTFPLIYYSYKERFLDKNTFLSNFLFRLRI